MPTEPSAQPQGKLQPHAKGYEKEDVRVRWVFGVVGFMVLLAIVIHFTLGWQLRALKKGPPPGDRWSGAKRPAREPAPPHRFPRLQLSPPADMAVFRAREETELNSYGWINQTAGIVRIPIERAMDMILQKGLLPVREGTNSSKAGPSSLQLQQQRPLDRKYESKEENEQK